MIGVDIILVLAVATVGLIVGRALRLPAVVAYLVAGVIVGPGGLGLVSRSATLEQLADLGVALLLFGVGIEFSLERLRRILPRMLTSGALQVGVTVLATAALFRWLGAPAPTAIFAGFLVSLSSTAIVFKLYTEDGEIEAPQGQAAAAILLFQDLALVPMMLLVPVLAEPPEEALAAAGMALLTAVVAVGILLVLARQVLPRALALVARAGTPELFPLAALVTAFGTALCAVQLGLSLPIGTFLAGLALSGSPYAHQVFAEILPLRDAFVAVFFTSIGMLLEPAVLGEQPGLLLGMLWVVVLKGVLCGLVVGLLWRSARLAILVGMGLAQIGEFSFVLSREGAASGVLPDSLEQAFLGAAILTMGATPFLMQAAKRLALAGTTAPGTGREPAMRDHVILIGCGTTGQAVARVLRETGVPFVAVDMLAEVVETASKEGIPVRFGDASRRAVLEEMGAASARAAVVTVGDPAATRHVVSLLRQLNADARIIVRAQRVSEIDELERLGADEVVAAELETSIELFVRLLAHLGVPRHVVRLQESLIRVGHYQALRGIGATEDQLAKMQQFLAGGIVETAQVMPGSSAAGKTLAEIDFKGRTGTNVLSVVRAEKPLPIPDGSTRLEAGDLVVLFGPHEAIDRALHLLEPREARAGEK